jgi:hypothetical protein
MDKVRAFMKVMWVQRFWVLSVVGVLAAFICWMMAASALQTEYAADKAVILAKFGDMETIRKKPFHGNADINAREREEAAKIAASVQELWQKLYDYQRKEVLYWPDTLGKEFLEHIEKRKFDQNISPLMRDRYLNYIKTRFDALLEIVEAQKIAIAGSSEFSRGGEGGEGGFIAPMPGDPGYVEDYKVQWLDQGELQAKLQFARRPTPREVWVRQEDLWVFETLLKVIAATNKERGATRPDNTAIRIIEQLQVGADAATTVESQILMPEGAVAAVSGEGEIPLESGRPMYGEGVEGDPASADAALLAYRYVDNEGKPIPDATAGLGVEYRRLPVRMRLQMDPRWIPKMLVECANAPLPVEVQRLRINPEQSGVGFDMASTGGGGEGGGYRGEGGGMYGGRGIGGGRSYGGEGGYSPSVVPTADLVTVEVEGLVYIYNAPDPSVLTVPGGEELAGVDATVVR